MIKKNIFTINFKFYLLYKFANAIHNGAIMSSVFFIYTPLPPIVFSVGGLVLSLGSFVVPMFYKKLINNKFFFIILAFTEMVGIVIILLILVFPISFLHSFLIFTMFQVVFVFSGYLIRSESLLWQKKMALSIIDRSREKGYLIGLSISSIIYFLCELGGIDDKGTQIRYLFYFILMIQTAVCFLLFSSLKPKIDK